MNQADIAEDDIKTASRQRRGSGKKTGSKPRKSRASKVRSIKLTPPVVGLGALAVVLLGTTAFFGWSVYNNSDAASTREAILVASRQEALALTTLSSQSGSKDYQAVLNGSAGDLKDEISAGKSQFLKGLGTAGVTSTGHVLDAGVQSVNGGSAKVLIDVQATVSNKQTANKPEQRAYHWQLNLVSSDGKWLVTNLEFV